MSLAILHSRAIQGIQAPLVTVEVHIANGLPSFSIVGLPDTAVKESKERVRSALLNSRFEFPAKRITVNLAPADLPKDGGRFDLPIALGILVASQQIAADNLDHYEFVGELALSGEIRPIQGVLPIALQTLQQNKQLMLPLANAAEASLVEQLTLLPLTHLIEACSHLLKTHLITPYQRDLSWQNLSSSALPDLSDVKGQHQAKRALEIAAAGSHNLLLIGPPGTGKSMLAKRLPSILPLLAEQEALEVAALMSISTHGFKAEYWRHRPLRAPHHTASHVALVGGSNPPRPGEISLAHHGVLFLDELPEFSRRVLETLREPLETGSITISRAAQQSEFPAKFQLIAAMNPCPCGYLTANEQTCRCTPTQIQRYQQHLSGPFLDRIDMLVHVPAIDYTSLNSTQSSESSATVRKRVTAARQKQQTRAGKLNSLLTVPEIERYCTLSQEHQQFLQQAIKKLNLSARAYHRLLKLARTIADLAHSERIEQPHLIEAIHYRRMDLVHPT